MLRETASQRPMHWPRSDVLTPADKYSYKWVKWVSEIELHARGNDRQELASPVIQGHGAGGDTQSGPHCGPMGLPLGRPISAPL
jgi:hypothetical protein